jgi:1,2-phenylacetyl-CoA epoxidase catalytic subunit
MVERSTNDIIESITKGLVHMAKHGTEEQIKEIVEFMNKKWIELNEIFDPSWFNKELAKVWRESHKAKEEIKNSTNKS